jgi:3',5'-cyclic-nucleotide phosphodiesterase
MQLRILGCHGGETPKHRTSSFLVGDSVAVDAGAITSGLSLREQERIHSVLISHPHMDHVRDLATLVDNRCQQGGTTLDIVGIPETIRALKQHFFNDVLWPDFTKINTQHGPTVRFVEAAPDQSTHVDGYEVTPVLVNHTVDTSAFIIRRDGKSIVYGGDTGPTEALWERVNALEDLQALMMEVSFPDDHARLAADSLHLTPRTLSDELKKLTQSPDLPIFVYHIKPVFEDRVHSELAKLRGRNLQILQLYEEFLF